MKIELYKFREKLSGTFVVHFFQKSSSWKGSVLNFFNTLVLFE